MHVKDNIHIVYFQTVTDYLTNLHKIAQTCHQLWSPPPPSHEKEASSSGVIFYLAAAVSDFYIPDHLLAQHKIQSGGGLVLELEPVPKMLSTLVHDWAPNSFVVSFKLETDETLVLEKAKGAIEKYGVHLVVANQLQVDKPSIHIYIYVSQLMCNPPLYLRIKIIPFLEMGFL